MKGANLLSCFILLAMFLVINCEDPHSCRSESQELCSGPIRSLKDFKIYLAGPLFNKYERQEMYDLALSVEKAGFKVFLPQRDGLLLSELTPIVEEFGLPQKEATKFLRQVIFDLDTYNVISSDGIVVNMDGRVPDEGTLVEAGIAWTIGNCIVLYKSDARSMILGLDNPLVEGLNDFVIVHSHEEVIKLLKDELIDINEVAKSPKEFPKRVQNAYLKGEQVMNLLLRTKDQREILKGLFTLYNKY